MKSMIRYTNDFNMDIRLTIKKFKKFQKKSKIMKNSNYQK